MRILFASIEWPFSHQPYRGPFAKSLAEALKDHHEVISLPLPLNRNPLNLIRYQQTIKRYYKSYNCEHIHCYSLNTLLMADPEKYPVSVSAIGSDVFGEINKNGNYTLKGNLAYQWIKRKFPYLKGIRCVSGSLKEKIQNDANKHVPVKVISNGIDLNRFPIKSRIEACEKLGWDPDDINTFFPGNPERGVKNFALASKLINEAQKERANIDLHVFPAVSPEKMNDYYRAADVVLVTSIHEGSSNSIKEALLCNTPVITTPVGDAEYWLSFDVYGSIIDFGVKPKRFTELILHYSQIRRNQEPGINRNIADQLDIRTKSLEFAEFINEISSPPTELENQHNL